MKKEIVTYRALLTKTLKDPYSPSDEAAKYEHARLEIFALRPNRMQKLIRITAQKHKNKDSQDWSSWYAARIEREPIGLDHFSESNEEPSVFAKDLEKFRSKVYKMGANFDSSFDAILAFLKAKKVTINQPSEFYTREEFFK